MSPNIGICAPSDEKRVYAEFWKVVAGEQHETRGIGTEPHGERESNQRSPRVTDDGPLMMVQCSNLARVAPGGRLAGSLLRPGARPASGNGPLVLSPCAIGAAMDGDAIRTPGPGLS